MILLPLFKPQPVPEDGQAACSKNSSPDLSVGIRVDPWQGSFWSWSRGSRAPRFARLHGL